MTEFTKRVFNTAQWRLAHEASDFATVQRKRILSEQFRTVPIISSVLSQLLLNSECFQANG